MESKGNIIVGKDTILVPSEIAAVSKGLLPYKQEKETQYSSTDTVPVNNEDELSFLFILSVYLKNTPTPMVITFINEQECSDAYRTIADTLAKEI